MCECKNETRGQVKDTVGGVGGGQAIQPNPVPARRAHTQSMGFWWTSCITILGTAIIVAWIPNLLSPEPPKGNVDGYVDPQFKKVEDLFRSVLFFHIYT